MSSVQSGLDIPPPVLAFHEAPGAVTVDIGRLLAGRLIIQGSSGAGKSRCLRYMLEQTRDTIPQLVVDWEGEFYTLRDVHPYIWVGDTAIGADLQVSAAAARMQCRRLIGTRASVILDLSDLPNHEARREVAALWLDELMRVHEQVKHVRMVAIDEIQELCPEGKAVVSSDAVKAIAARGRKRGLGLVGGTQRLSRLHKDAAEAQTIWIGLTTQDVDVDRAARILGFDAKKARTLTELHPGQFLCLGRAMPQRGVILTMSGEIESAHPDAMINTEAPPTPAEISAALSAIREQGDELDADAAGRAELLEEIDRLKEQLAEARAGNTSDPEDIKRAVARATAPLLEEIRTKDLTRETMVSHLRLALLAAGEIPVQTPVTEELDSAEIRGGNVSGNDFRGEDLRVGGPCILGALPSDTVDGKGGSNSRSSRGGRSKQGNDKGRNRDRRRKLRVGELAEIEIRMLEYLREHGEVPSNDLATSTGQGTNSTSFRKHRKRLVDGGFANYTRRGYIAPVLEDDPLTPSEADLVQALIAKAKAHLVAAHNAGRANVRHGLLAEHLGLDRWSETYAELVTELVNLNAVRFADEYGVECLQATDKAFEHQPEAPE